MMQLTKEWRPIDWPDGYEVVRKTKDMLSTSEVFELGASTMLIKVCEELKKRNINLVKVLK